jgi:hypothetical protein
MHPFTHSPMHHAPMHPCIHAPMHPCIHAPMHPCTHASMHPCTHEPVHPCMSLQFSRIYKFVKIILLLTSNLLTSLYLMPFCRTPLSRLSWHSFQVLGKENFKSATHVGSRATLVCNDNDFNPGNKKSSQVPKVSRSHIGILVKIGFYLWT